MRSPNEHERAVRAAEIRHLTNALRPYGVLSRDALERAAGRTNWMDHGGFTRALAAAVAQGAIKELPLGFYRDASVPSPH